MQNGSPVTLAEKVASLVDSIHLAQQQVKHSDKFDIKMKFIDFVDNALERVTLLMLSAAPLPANQLLKQQENLSSSSADENLREKNRIQQERQSLAQNLKQLHQRQMLLQIDRYKLEADNEKIEKEKLGKQSAKKQQNLRQRIIELEEKVRLTEREMDKLIKLNTAQAKELEHVKEERNRAQKKTVELMEKYDAELAVIQSVKEEKKKKCNYSGLGDLRVERTITNITNTKKKTERFVLCELPLKFQVLRIVYGIRLAISVPNRQPIFLNEVNLYERENMIVHNQGDTLVVTYVKRKVEIRLDQYKVLRPHVNIMLFGKGDSIVIDESRQE